MHAELHCVSEASISSANISRAYVLMREMTKILENHLFSSHICETDSRLRRCHSRPSRQRSRCAGYFLYVGSDPKVSLEHIVLRILPSWKTMGYGPSL